jgi:hypothetical protein
MREPIHPNITPRSDEREAARKNREATVTNPANTYAILSSESEEILDETTKTSTPKTTKKRPVLWADVESDDDF